MDADRLKAVPLFASLSGRERSHVARWADEVDVPVGRHLVDQGNFAHEFFVIEEGTAQVTVDDEHVTDLGPGDFFGEIALLESDRRTASVLATTPMRVIVMHARDFRRMDSELPAVADRIRRAVRERLSRSQG